MWKIPENVTRLVEAWKRGDSASMIASVLGCSRNAVIGKAHRLGLAVESPRPSRTGPKKAKPPEPRFWPKIPSPVPESPVDLHKPSGVGVSILEAKWRQCRDVIDPHGSPEGLALFCGEPTIKEGPWCAYHHKKNTDQWRGRRS